MGRGARTEQRLPKLKKFRPVQQQCHVYTPSQGVFLKIVPYKVHVNSQPQVDPTVVPCNDSPHLMLTFCPEIPSATSRRRPPFVCTRTMGQEGYSDDDNGIAQCVRKGWPKQIITSASTNESNITLQVKTCQQRQYTTTTPMFANVYT